MIEFFFSLEDGLIPMLVYTAMGMNTDAGYVCATWFKIKLQQIFDQK